MGYACRGKARPTEPWGQQPCATDQGVNTGSLGVGQPPQGHKCAGQVQCHLASKKEDPWTSSPFTVWRKKGERSHMWSPLPWRSETASSPSAAGPCSLRRPSATRGRGKRSDGFPSPRGSWPICEGGPRSTGQQNSQPPTPLCTLKPPPKRPLVSGPKSLRPGGLAQAQESSEPARKLEHIKLDSTEPQPIRSEAPTTFYDSLLSSNYIKIFICTLHDTYKCFTKNI